MLAAGAGAIVGCGHDGPGAAALEQQLPVLVAPQDPGVVSDVSCPAGVPTGDGEATRCRARVDGVEVTVLVSRRAAEAAVSLDRALLVLDDVEAAVAARLTAELGVGVTVRCDGARVRVAADATVLSCDGADASGRVRPLRVAADALGALDVTFA